jgi:hypothetical protein
MPPSPEQFDLALNINFTSKEELERLAGRTQLSVTELVRFGLSLVKLYYDAQDRREKLVIANENDRIVKEIVSPWF